MIQKAAEMGTKITILATAESTLGPTKSKLLREVEKLNKEINLSVIVCPDAYEAIKAGDIEYHDETIKRRALEIKQQDVVILAQASMAHLEGIVGKICGCPVLSSPRLCIEQLKATLTTI
jgi:Asp/Glu/hydantoin racemase